MEPIIYTYNTIAKEKCNLNFFILMIPEKLFVNSENCGKFGLCDTSCQNFVPSVN